MNFDLNNVTTDEISYNSKIVNLIVKKDAPDIVDIKINRAKNAINLTALAVGKVTVIFTADNAVQDAELKINFIDNTKLIEIDTFANKNLGYHKEFRNIIDQPELDKAPDSKAKIKKLF